jgi:hypothetical protein
MAMMAVVTRVLPGYLRPQFHDPAKLRQDPNFVKARLPEKVLPRRQF